VDEIAEKVSTNGGKLKFAERIFWVLVTAAVSTAFWYFK
jgi:hypothetical protein